MQICQFYLTICFQNKNFHPLVLLKTKLTYWCVLGLRCCAVHQSMHISFLCMTMSILPFWIWMMFPKLRPESRSTSLLRPNSPITWLMHIFIDPMVFGCIVYLWRITSILNITTALCVWSESLIICLELYPNLQKSSNSSSTFTFWLFENYIGTIEL